MKTYKKKCEMCGEEIEYTCNNNRRCYCDKCREIAKKRNSIKSYEKKKEMALLTPTQVQRERHQKDREVWGYNPTDYAEKQKAKTLTMIGRIL